MDSTTAFDFTSMTDPSIGGASDVQTQDNIDSTSAAVASASNTDSSSSTGIDVNQTLNNVSAGLAALPGIFNSATTAVAAAKSSGAVVAAKQKVISNTAGTSFTFSQMTGTEKILIVCAVGALILAAMHVSILHASAT